MENHVLITGCAGFIGFHTAQRLLAKGFKVTGLDNLNSYYDVTLKNDRLKILCDDEKFTFHKVDISSELNPDANFGASSIDYVIHLAAQAGVRYSIDNPQTYGKSNLTGFLNILEWVRHNPVRHFIYASSSSVYGDTQQVPFRESARCDNPVSLYAATKRANELMAESYAHLYCIPSTGLRFFTVYGPFGRPDMAPMKFAQQILNGGTIDVFNQGEMSRDFTYIDDIVEGIIRLLTKPPHTTKPSHRILNIGRGAPINLLRFIEILESSFGQVVQKRFLPMQNGDVTITWADISELAALTGYQPKTDITEGVRKFAQWYQNYYHNEHTQ